MKSWEESGESAFPLEASKYGGYGSQFGMSLRDYFAAKAMNGALSAAAGDEFAERLRERSMIEGKTIAEVLAMDSYATADAMLAERAK